MKKILSKGVSGFIVQALCTQIFVQVFAGKLRITVQRLSKFGVPAVVVRRCAAVEEELQEMLEHIQREQLPWLRVVRLQEL
jgi:hypothetical protein